MMRIQDALRLAMRFRSRNKIVEALGRVRLQADGSQCCISATSLECEIVTAGVPCSASFDVLVDSERLAVALGDADCSMQINGENLVVRRGRSVFRIHAMQGNMYPEIGIKGDPVPIPHEHIASAQQVAWAAKREDNLRPWLMGVHIMSTATESVVEAADGAVWSRVKGPSSGEFDFAIPVSVIGKIKGMRATGMARRGDFLEIEFAEGIVRSKLMLNFPKLPNLAPKGDFSLTFNRQEVMTVLSEIAGFGDATEIGDHKISVARMSVSDGRLLIKGQRDTEFEVDARVAGVVADQAFRCDQLHGILSSMSGDEVTMLWDEGGVGRCMREGAWEGFISPMRL